jgi:hypothetical protein
MAWILLAFAALATLVLAGRTVFFLSQSLTTVPVTDQWSMLEEIWRFQTGEYHISYLWMPYWGHRLVVPRLLFLLAARFAGYSSKPLVLINVAAQTALIAIIIRTIRSVLGGRSVLTWLATIAAVHLLLSCLQMEIWIFGMSVQYSLGALFAIAAFALMSHAAHSRRADGRFCASLICALLSTACIASGLLIWPVLAIEAWWLRLGLKKLSTLIAAGVTVVAVYLTHYERPEIGMGLSGMLHRPFAALELIGMVLGGPVSLFSVPLGAIAGALGICGISAIFAIAPHVQNWNASHITLLSIAVFEALVAVSVVAGRISPEWVNSLHGQGALPSRYFASTFVFWAALFALALSFCTRNVTRHAPALITALPVLGLTFGTWNWQWRLSREWAAVYETYDAAGSGFLTGVSDQSTMARIYPDERLRERWLGFLREQHWSVFGEERANWIGRPLPSGSGSEKSQTCGVTLKRVPLQPSAGERLSGIVRLNSPRVSRTDLLFADTKGIVRGLARTIPADVNDPNSIPFLGYTTAITGVPRVVARVGGVRLLSCSVTE